MKPTLLNLVTNEEIRCTGVPEGLLRTQGVDWSHGAGGAMHADFLRVPPGQFVLEMTIEGFTPGVAPRDVREQLGPVEAAVKTAPNGSPPPFLLTWGSVRFPVLVEHVEIAYTRFAPAGFPTSARLRFRLVEAVDRTRIAAAIGGAVAAVAGAVGAATQPARQLLQQMEAKVQTVRRAVQSVAADARQRVEAAQTPLRAVEREVRSAAAHVEREVRRVERDARASVTAAETQVREQTEALAQGARHAEQEVEGEVNQRLNDVRAEGERAMQQVKDEVGRQEQAVQQQLATPIRQ